MKIDSIVIVGGGSAGWMTCAALCENFKNIKITLVESNIVNAIGVGESNLPEINRFLKLCNLKDKDFMSHCNATYKLSIKFNNFNTKNSFHYPLCKVKKNNNIDQIPPSILLSLIDERNLSYETFANYFHETTDLCDLNKMSYDSEYADDLNDDYVSYHFESYKFAEFLRGRYKNHITYIVDDVSHLEQDDMGITQILCKSGASLNADLYIDCTGFKSLLIKNFSEFIKYDTLCNDRAVVSPVEYDDIENQMVPYTNCTGLSSGWVWEIPTWSRKGMGYVYSSKFISDDDAKKEFIRFIGKNTETRIVDIVSGVRKKGWCKNVVSIGLSYGFVEPLESTGLATTQEAILKLINTLQSREGYVNSFDIEKYNETIDDQITAMKNFTELHYAMSNRMDTPYWKYVTNDIDYKSESLSGLFKLINSGYELDFDNCFPAIYIFAGMGYSLNNKILSKKDQRSFYDPVFNPIFDDAFDRWKEHRKNLKIKIQNLKSHYQFLKENIYI
jgi:tryptophan halogenase